MVVMALFRTMFARLNVIFAKFDEVQKSGNMILSSAADKNFDEDDSTDGNRPSSASSTSSKAPSSRRTVGTSRRPGSSAVGLRTGTVKDGAGAVDEDDFIRAFEEVPTVQIFSNRDLEESFNKIREVLSDDKHDWEQRVAALKKIRSLMLSGAAEYECFFQNLRLLDGAFKLSAKDLRSQVVREACITLGHLSSVLGNRFDHGAEAIMPTLFNLVPNSAKVIATSGIAAIRLIIRFSDSHAPHSYILEKSAVLQHLSEMYADVKRKVEFDISVTPPSFEQFTKQDKIIVLNEGEFPTHENDKLPRSCQFSAAKMENGFGSSILVLLIQGSLVLINGAPPEHEGAR
ncbi:CLIP-associating protein 1-like [Rhincodon typus]|uniref:CLIP-associating protein 1-like n=1 Tax=Rhincodon typus TaxID=259920 RepID=UPI00203041A7|nr:CLIP-associating protein 1-like [Rhincodon typus]